MTKPLIPALTRREREKHRQPVGGTAAIGNIEGERCGSLSPGERVRVRAGAALRFHFGNLDQLSRTV